MNQPHLSTSRGHTVPGWIGWGLPRTCSYANANLRSGNWRQKVIEDLFFFHVGCMGEYKGQKPFVKKNCHRICPTFASPLWTLLSNVPAASAAHGCFILTILVPHRLIGSARTIASLPTGTARGKQLIFQIVQNCLLVYVIQFVSNSIERRSHRFTLLEKPQVKPASPIHQKSIYGNTPTNSIIKCFPYVITWVLYPIYNNRLKSFIVQFI